MSQQQIIKTLNGQVGKHSVLLALSATVGDAHIFSPSPEPPTQPYTATHPDQTPSKNVIFDTDSKPEKKQVGRPKKWYVIPSPTTLCKQFGISISGADPITREDIQSATAYRQALHCKLIKRRPGQYSRSLLSNRLGMSIQTIRRYDQQTGVQAGEMYTQVQLFQHNIDRYVPRNYEHASPGIFLQNASGKRFPLKYPLACKLLTKGNLYVMFREPNYYWIGDHTPLPPANYIQQLPPPNDEAIAAYWNTPVETMILKPSSGEKTRPQPVFVKPIPQHAPEWIEQSRRYEPDSAYWTRQLYEQVNERASDEQRISQHTANNLMNQYGVKAIKKALWLLDQCDNVQNPAGWIITVLRSNSKQVS